MEIKTHTMSFVRSIGDSAIRLQYRWMGKLAKLHLPNGEFLR